MSLWPRQFIVNQSSQFLYNLLDSDLESYFEKWSSAEDPELAFAMKLSIADQFANKQQQTEDSLSSNIRLFTGGVENWVFNKNSVVEVISHIISSVVIIY